jgi:hypothetical protein
MGLSLARLLRAEAQAEGTGLTPRADACIILFLDGGPSHLDMWDMKPDAPAEIRGEFRAKRAPPPARRGPWHTDRRPVGAQDSRTHFGRGHGGVRPPKVNAAAGRDHWNHCYSLMLIGGGVKAAYVHGSSDKIGGNPNSFPVIPAEIIATIYHCLGIPADLELRDRFERPFALVPWGRPILEIVG